MKLIALRDGLELINGTAQVEILRSQVDGKMAKLLTGAGGACRQIFTASFIQIHGLDFVNDGFPVNKSINDALLLFQEVNEEEFLSLSSDQRFNITHKPISSLNIVPSSPLHAYLRWFFQLVPFSRYPFKCRFVKMVTNFEKCLRRQELYYKSNKI